MWQSCDEKNVVSLFQVVLETNMITSVLNLQTGIIPVTFFFQNNLQWKPFLNQ